MKELANRLAMQHLVNAYAQETGQATLLEKYQQNSTQISFSQGLTLLSISLASIHAQLWVPLSYVSLVGRHRIAQLPQLFIQGQLQSYSSVAMVSLLLEDYIQQVSQPQQRLQIRLQPDIQPSSQAVDQLDAAYLVERWIQSRDALHQFLEYRSNDFDGLRAFQQSFIQSEQSLIAGHSMHPAPKSRTGFIYEDWVQYCPEMQGQTRLHYWLVAPEYIAEDCAETYTYCMAEQTDHVRSSSQTISEQLRQQLSARLSESEQQYLQQYIHYKLLPLHPWQARYLQSKPWYASLQRAQKLIDLGELGWLLSPTTSVRTLASFDAPWQFKLSLSVMVTNSVRVNLEKEGHRGVLTYKLWQSDLGRKILSNCPTLKAVNDPAWIALKWQGQVINETLCIFREQPFSEQQQVTCIAALCEDHPTQAHNRFHHLFESIAQQQLKLGQSQSKHDIARQWFERFLAVSLTPLMYLYHCYGMAFESHQQNVLLELEHAWPKNLWLRDNQGFYYIEELAQDILAEFPELIEKAQAVGSQAFVDERFSYYFFGNTLFGVINAIGTTGLIHEAELIGVLRETLEKLSLEYPKSTLLQTLLNAPTLAYKANLLTRLYELDELTAPVEQQSVYIKLSNPMYRAQQQDMAYA